VRRVHDGDAGLLAAPGGLRARRVRGRAADASSAGADAPDDHDLDQLTPREREVLQHIARGYLYKEIAQRLGISVKTVEAHVSAVLRKLQLSTRHELTRWAWERWSPPRTGTPVGRLTYARQPTPNAHPSAAPAEY
jgi:DNA-binding CsgD family transcriptional regulator